MPETSATVVVSDLNDAEAAAAMATAMSMSVEVSGAAHLPESVRGRFVGGALPDGAATVLRLEGLTDSVAVRSEKLVAAMARFGAVSRLDAEGTQRLWREVRDAVPYADGTSRPLWRVSVAPIAGQQLVAALRLETGVDAFYDWQGGLVWAHEFFPSTPLVVTSVDYNTGIPEIVMFLKSEQFDTTGFYNYLKNKLPLYMLPGKIQFVNEIPTTTSGKIDRNKLKEILNND